jgi:hypothetical protein
MMIIHDDIAGDRGRQTAKMSNVGLSYYRRQGSSPHTRQAGVTRPGLIAGALGPKRESVVYWYLIQ